MEHAAGTMQAFRAGICAERLRAAAQEGGNDTLKKQSDGNGPRTRSGPVRTYAEAASAAVARPAARTLSFRWDQTRTVYLAPKDPEAAKVSIEQYAFGRKLQSLFPPPPLTTTIWRLSASNAPPPMGGRCSLLRKLYSSFHDANLPFWTLERGCRSP